MQDMHEGAYTQKKEEKWRVLLASLPQSSIGKKRIAAEIGLG
jgi:hypothetical protein